MVERRKTARARTLLGGVIAFNKRASTMDCQVRNLSPAGAKVTFVNTAVVPDQFDLTIARKERSFRARMIWRTPNEAGVSFLNEYDQNVPVPLEWAKRLRDCEAEKTALRRRVAQLTESSGA
ncbi:MAG TPA: PilZ domain-containing protein [Pseudolabrys sp.]